MGDTKLNMTHIKVVSPSILALVVSLYKAPHSTIILP